MEMCGNSSIANSQNVQASAKNALDRYGFGLDGNIIIISYLFLLINIYKIFEALKQT